jgi:cysteine-rich repeat protein
MKFTKQKSKILSKCRERESNPATTACPDAADTERIGAAQAKMLNKINKKCAADKFDPSGAIGYTACAAIPGCSAVDQSPSAAGYVGCIECASDAMTDLVARVPSDGACGNGKPDAGEECDDGNKRNGDGCSRNCLTEAVCGNGKLELRDEECDPAATPTGCPDGLQCVTEELANECTCVPACTLDGPLPTRFSFTSKEPTGVCGCTVNSIDEMTCGNAATKINDLGCGSLFIGGGLSTVPPGSTPDGATTFAAFTGFCSGDELFIGPDPGSGIKDCSDAGCFYGPALPVRNTNKQLSACVLNTLNKPIQGTLNITTGASSLSASLSSKTFLTGDLIFSTCRGGTNSGAPCSRQTPSDCVGGICVDDVEGQCSTDGESCAVPVCEGGSRQGSPCADDSGCPGGACRRGVCTDASGTLCNTDGDCPLTETCQDDCPAGTCENLGFTVDAVQPCPTCVDGSFKPAAATCNGGPQDGEPCAVDRDCEPGACAAGVGTCNLGPNEGGACTSTNSDGLTVDCPPFESLFIATVPVTLDQLTTGTATLAAADGNFCDFRVCVGGFRDGLGCRDLEDCPRGVACQLRCQGGSDAGLACNTSDDCIQGERSGSSCGQRTGGAFQGGTTVQRILEFGTPAPGPIQIGDVKDSTIAAVFCIPRLDTCKSESGGGSKTFCTTDADCTVPGEICVGQNDVNNAADLPGPGATSLPGTFQVFGPSP